MSTENEAAQNEPMDENVPKIAQSMLTDHGRTEAIRMADWFASQSKNAWIRTIYTDVLSELRKSE